MSWMYILVNKDTNRYYVGSTSNLVNRLKQHKNGNTRTTRVFKILDLVYFEEFSTDIEAKKRERQIKSYKSKKYIKWLIDSSKGH